MEFLGEFIGEVLFSMLGAGLRWAFFLGRIPFSALLKHDFYNVVVSVAFFLLLILSVVYLA